MKNIIYNDEGLNVVHAGLVGDDLIREADKTVPFAVPYKVIDSSEIPADRIFRNAWEVADSEMTNGVGGELKAKADLIEADACLVLSKENVATDQINADGCTELLANAQADFDEKEAAALKAEAEENAEEAKKKRDEANLAQKHLTSRSAYSQSANARLAIAQSEQARIEEDKADAEKRIQQCLDALPLDKRSA